MSELLIRKSKNKVWRTVNITAINDNNLSWRAKGIFYYLTTRPENWKIRMSDLINRSLEGRDAIYKALNELEENKYIYRYQEKENGKFSRTIYVVFDSNEDYEEVIPPLPENPDTEEPLPEKPYPENQEAASKTLNIEYNIYRNNNNKLNNKKKNKDNLENKEINACAREENSIDFSEFIHKEEAIHAYNKCINPSDFHRALRKAYSNYSACPEAIKEALEEFGYSPKLYSVSYLVRLIRTKVEEYAFKHPKKEETAEKRRKLQKQRDLRDELFERIRILSGTIDDYQTYFDEREEIIPLHQQKIINFLSEVFFEKYKEYESLIKKRGISTSKST